jgi:hypothetical protein
MGIGKTKLKKTENPAHSAISYKQQKPTKLKNTFFPTNSKLKNKKTIAIGIVLLFIGPVILFLPNLMYKSTLEYSDWRAMHNWEGDTTFVFGRVTTVKDPNDNLPLIEYDMKEYVLIDRPSVANDHLFVVYGNKDKSLGIDGLYAILEIRIDETGKAIVEKFYDPLIFEIPGIICFIVGTFLILAYIRINKIKLITPLKTYKDYKKIIALGVALVILGPIILFTPNVFIKNVQQYNDWISSPTRKIGDTIFIYGYIQSNRAKEDLSPHTYGKSRGYLITDGPKMSNREIYVVGNKDYSIGNDGEYVILEIELEGGYFERQNLVIKHFYTPLIFQIPGLVFIILGIIDIMAGYFYISKFILIPKGIRRKMK